MGGTNRRFLELLGGPFPLGGPFLPLSSPFLLGVTGVPLGGEVVWKLVEDTAIGVESAGFCFYPMDLKRGPLAVDRGAAKIKHRLGAVDRPTHAGTLHPVFHDVPASALDHAAGNGQAGRQVFAVTHSIAVAMKVVADLS